MRHKISVDAQAIYDRLKRAEVGEVVTYEELSDILGRDVRAGAYRALSVARWALVREEQIVFGTVTNEGVCRLSDGEAVEAGATRIKAIRKAARRGAMVTSAVKAYDRLTPDEQKKHNATLSIFGAILHGTSRKHVLRVEEAVASCSATLPAAKTLEMFK